MNIRKLIAKAMENWPIKVLSLGLAIVLYIFHRMSVLEDRFFSVPLNIEHMGLLLPSSSYPRTVRVNLRGEANSIYPILEDDIAVYIDIEKFETPGVYTVPVQWRKLGTARMVEPLQITVDPVEVTLSLDKRISKVVPVTANFRGQVDTGHAMTSYFLSPAQVILDGPAELLWEISEISTDTIDLNGRRSDFTITTNILNHDNLILVRGNGITEFHGYISALIPVRNILNVPITVTGMAAGFTGEPEPKSVGLRLEGTNQALIDRFQVPPDFLRIDCSGITEPGTYVLEVLAGPYENMDIIIDPEEVTVRISHAGNTN